MSNPSAPDVPSLLAAFATQPMFWVPDRLRGDSGWGGHVPFAFWLIDALRPRVVVELGTRTGVSLCAFDEAVARLGLDARCIAVAAAAAESLDDLRQYHDPRYGGFSRLLQSDFAQAADAFADGSVDLLHVNGRHGEKALDAALAAWRRKLSDRAVLLIHQTQTAKEAGGAAAAWRELSATRPHFEFVHGHGLGVAGIGSAPPPPVQALLAAGVDPELTAMIRERFGRLGDSLMAELRARAARDELSSSIRDLDEKRRRVRRRLRLGKGILGSVTWKIASRLAAVERRFRTPKSRKKTSRSDKREEYSLWVSLFDSPSPNDRDHIQQETEALGFHPLFSIVMPTYNTPELLLHEAIESVRGQIYPHWELCIADDASSAAGVATTLGELARADPRIKVTVRQHNGGISAASNSALAMATGDFVALMDHDDTLAPHALLMVARAVNDQRDLDIIYSDEDRIDRKGRRVHPYFKPDWDPELILHQNFVSHLSVIRTDLVRRAGGFREGLEGSQDWDLILRTAALTTAGRIRHLPFVLYHWREVSTSFSSRHLEKAQRAGCIAVQDYLAATGQAGEAVPAAIGHGFVDVRRPIPDSPPLVSIIIPTRDRMDLLRPCVEGVLNRTDYPEIEVVIVDNDSVEWRTLSYFGELRADPRVKVMPYPGAFNYAAMNNAAVRACAGSILCFLNNDIEVIGEGWLRSMVAQAIRPDIGAVGARLLYGDGRVQHGGTIMGFHGGVDHAFRFLPGEDPGYFTLAHLTRSQSCVTAACMVVRREAFESVGGFDEVTFQIAHNDLDLCLKLRERGLSIVYEASAELFHYESVSRGVSLDPRKHQIERRESQAFKERWGHLFGRDPFYSPNLSQEEDFKLAFPPRVARPWESDCEAR